MGKNRRSAGILFVLAAVFLKSSFIYANTGEVYGFGSRASGLGNCMLGGNDDGFATYYNPASNSAHPGFHLSYALAMYTPQFKEMNGIVVKNTVFYPTKGDVVGDIKNDDYNNHIGQVLGASFNLGENLWFTSIGVTAFLPVDRIAYMDSGETLRPEYFNYRSRTQRPQIFASLSSKPKEHFYVGLGLATAMNMEANATIYTTATANSASAARFTASMKPGLSPYFSLYTDPKPFLAGLTFRLKNKYKTSLDTGADAKTFGTAGDFSVVLNAASTLYYDPMEVNLAFGWEVTHKTLVMVEVDWFEYQAFEPPSLFITGRPGGSLTPSNSIITTPNMQNIFVPKLGVEHVWGRLIGRIGGWYRPSPVKDNDGAGNLVDPSKIVGTLGFGFDLEKWGVTHHKVRIDIHGQYHHLLSKKIEKTPGNELGMAGETKIGSPGYTIGGNLFGGGLTASLEL